ncbi:MAG: cell division topological specificity factor MinE [Anaerolineae bacterium]|nr:cell division topological specificity factor MinE [Anaerolineae bacterium]
MSILDRLFGRTEPSSSQVAKERLQLVLTSDRTNLTPALLELMRDDIIRSISEHVEIDRSGIQLSVSQGRGYHRVVADIPVVRARESSSPPRPTPRRSRPAPSVSE